MTPITLTPKDKAPLVLIVTPVHDHKLHVCMAVSVMNMMATRAVSTKMFLPGQSGISKARNHGLWHFMNAAPEATHIFFWDGDIEAKDNMLPALLERKVPVVGWLYGHKSDNLRWCLNLTVPEGVKEDDEVEPIKEGPLAGLLPVETLGTGGMLIERSAIEKVIELFGEELAYLEDQESDGGATPRGATSYAFCQERMVSPNGPEAKLERIKHVMAGAGLNPEAYMQKFWDIQKIVNEPQKPGRFLTEDWYLCKLFKRAGIPMYVDCRFHVLHEGMTRYPHKEKRQAPWV